MSGVSMSKRLKFWLTEPRYPNVGLEFNSDCIRLAAVAVDKGRLRIQHLDSEALPAGSVEINPFKPNIHDLESVTQALKSIWSRNRFKASRVCLLLQDRCALPFQVTMEQPSTSHEECLDLLKFKLKKNIPFRIEEARISFWNSSGMPDFRATSLWAILIHDVVLKQYEKLIATALDAECGLVDLSTLDLLSYADSQLRAAFLHEKDLLYVNLNRDYISLAITQKSRLMFYRTRSLEKNNGVVQEALAEIHPAQMYYLDKLGGQNLDHCFLYATEFADDLCRDVEDKLGLSSTVLSLESYFKDQVDPSNVSLGRSFVPLVGLIASRKVQFV